MSTLALPIYRDLIARGMSENNAREAAEAALAKFQEQAAEAAAEQNAKSVEQATTKAAEHTAQAVAHSEEKAEGKFVSKTEYHERDKTLATRADISDVRAEMNTGFAQLRAEMAQIRAEMTQLRAEMHNMNRIGVGLLFAIFALAATLVANSIIAG